MEGCIQAAIGSQLGHTVGLDDGTRLPAGILTAVHLPWRGHWVLVAPKKP